MVSERRVCGLLSIAVSSYRYQASDGNAELRGKIVELARVIGPGVFEPPGMLVFGPSWPSEGRGLDDEEEAFFRRADCWSFEAG